MKGLAWETVFLRLLLVPYTLYIYVAWQCFATMPRVDLPVIALDDSLAESLVSFTSWFYDIMCQEQAGTGLIIITNIY